MVRSACLLLLLLLSGLARCEDTLDDVIKRTDMGNADSVFTLAEWCAEHNKPTTARHYYGKCIEIDRDYEAARARLGQVRVGDRWVAAAQAPAGAKPAAGANGASAPVARGSAGPGPAAKDVAWDLNVPGASGDTSFVDGQIERMNRAKNDSDDMDSAVLTLLRADCRPQAAAAPVRRADASRLQRHLRRLPDHPQAAQGGPSRHGAQAAALHRQVQRARHRRRRPRDLLLRRASAARSPPGAAPDRAHGPCQ